MRNYFVFGTITKYRRNYDHLSERHQANSYHVDHWGCGWQTAMGGMEGQVVTHPLADWSALERINFLIRKNLPSGENMPGFLKNLAYGLLVNWDI